MLRPRGCSAVSQTCRTTGSINPYFSSGPGCTRPPGAGNPAAQKFDRILALIFVVRAELVEHPAFALPVSTRIAQLQLRQPIFFQFFAHVHSHHLPVSFFHESTTLFASPQFHSPGVF